MTDTVASAVLEQLRQKNIKNRRLMGELRSMLARVTEELSIVNCAWLLAEDDERRTKALYLSPVVVRGWRKLVTDAKKVGVKADDALTYDPDQL